MHVEVTGTVWAVVFAVAGAYTEHFDGGVASVVVGFDSEAEAEAWAGTQGVPGYRVVRSLLADEEWRDGVY